MEEHQVELKDIAEIVAILLHYGWEGKEPKVVVPGKATNEEIYEGLKDLKLVFKYLRFDMEASRREIIYLKNLLESK